MTDHDYADATLRRWREEPASMVREEFNAEPDPFQLEALHQFPRSPRLAMKACKGPGKGHPLDLRLYTPAGVCRWGDLVVGDEIFAGDGSVTTITAIHDRGIQPLYRVVFDDDTAVECDADHLWSVEGRTERRHGSGFALLTCPQILARGVRLANGRWQQRQFAIPRQGAAQFPHQDVPLDPYVLGVWLGDGGRQSGRVTSADPILDAEIERRGFRLGSKDAPGHTATVYGISTILRALNLFSLGSHERYVPELYRTGSVAQRLDLLRGLMDTDGTIDDDGCCEFCVTSPRLAADVVYLVRSLGGTAWQKDAIKQGWYPNEVGERVMCRLAYRVTINLPVCPFLSATKATRWQEKEGPEAERYLKRYIDRIEPIDAAETRCIEVAHPSGLYLTNDFIVTHNTTVLAWIILNFLATRPHPRVGATSITGDNLASNLWPELAKWMQRSPFFSATFTWAKTQIVHKAYSATWWAQARTWPKSADPAAQANALAGLHADYVLAVLDESGGIPMGVMATVEAILASCVEGHIVQAGNPDKLEGPLYTACTTQRHLWYVITVTGDPTNPKAWVHHGRAAKMDKNGLTPLKWAEEQIATYGRENPWVMVNVLGEFPPSSINALLGAEDVEAAMARTVPESAYDWAQKRLGIDVARFGDDRTVMFPRQGIASFRPLVMRNARTTNIAARAAKAITDWGQGEEVLPFVDDTGHWGHGVIDNLLTAGYPVIPVIYSDPALDPRYRNRRAEFWMLGSEWVKGGGCLPYLPEMIGELITPTYSFVNGKFIIEPKEMVKARLGRSPDLADALFETFAIPDMPNQLATKLQKRGRTAKHDFDPNESSGTVEHDFDPNM